MCIPYDGACDGWTHPFARTLHVGDLLVLQGLPPEDYNTSYPYSDIIVFHEYADPKIFVVHRIAAVDNVSGKLYFHTKGDGNGVRWPASVTPSQYDNYPIESSDGVSEDLVVGRVVFRIPWIGNVVLFMQTPTGVILVALLIVLLLVIEFIGPALKKKPAATESSK